FNKFTRGHSLTRSYGLFICCFLFLLGCRAFAPQAIDTARIYDSPLLLDSEPQIQRGEPRKVIDAVGWVWGIPNKILLWDRRVENHKISLGTEAAIANYLYANQLSTVRVRLNQYRPGEDWSRLVRNKSVGAGWRYTFGAVSVLGETLLPGRIFGGDHFNPFTNTVHIYSDIPAIAIHEGAHSKDFARRRWKGTYAAVYALPIVPLYHESIASRDVVAYLEAHGSRAEQAAAQRILVPAYGTYAGNAGGYVLPRYGFPIYYGSLLAGHAWGRYQAHQIMRLPESD
ncbi:MAG: hypothetical protein KDA51_09785, partial [Planctomycetales bacterium]|nr:hypothetical protein [Planctomycetales bacterium]